MRIIKPSFSIEEEIDAKKIMSVIERAGRTCYKSESSISEESADKFIANILKRGQRKSDLFF